jgi:hypothetical protein
MATVVLSRQKANYFNALPNVGVFFGCCVAATDIGLEWEDVAGWQD